MTIARPARSNVKTIIFSPPGPVDLERVRERLAHAGRRGYSILSFEFDWAAVDRALKSARAQIVLFAGADRVDSDSPTVRTKRGRTLTADRVREIVDLDATAPIGIDPESIAAARRIARRLAEMERPSPSVQDPGCN